MSHSANIGLERTYETHLCLSLNTPAALRFPAMASSFGTSSLRTTHFDVTDRSITPIGHLPPRFTLVVTNVGTDDQELGALSDGSAGRTHPTRLPRVEGAGPVLVSRGTARPRRLATFSSNHFES